MTLKSKKFTRPVMTPFEEDADPGIPRTGKHATRDGDAEARGKRNDAKTGSPSETGRAAGVGGRLMPFFDLQRNLIVELKPAALRSILDAATPGGRPVSYYLKLIVYPRDTKGFTRVVADGVTRLRSLFD